MTDMQMDIQKDMKVDMKKGWPRRQPGNQGKSLKLIPQKSPLKGPVRAYRIQSS